MTTTVRITEKAQGVLREIADRSGVSMQDVLDRAVEVYRRHLILNEANRAYSIMKADPDLWNAELSERRLWESTLSDGIEDKKE